MENGLLLNYCKCGCGNRVSKPDNHYILLHHMKDPEMVKKIMKFHIGSKRSLEARKKMSAWQIGRKLPQSMIDKATKWRKEHPVRYWLGKKMPIEMKIKMSLRRKGKLNPNWKGGISTLINLLRTCEKYQQWRKMIYERDNYICQKCFEKGNGNLEAYHSPEISKILLKNKIDTIEKALLCKQLWLLQVGITLCEDCHHIIHGCKFSYKKPIQINLNL